jgi:hypothetical protein
MCARCPIGDGYPAYGRPGTRPHDQGPGDYGAPPDLGRPDYGPAPPSTLFGLLRRKAEPARVPRWPAWTHRGDD